MFDASGEPLGVLHVARSPNYVFSDQDARLIGIIANVAATAIERGLAVSQLERQLRQTQTLLRTVEMLALGSTEEIWQDLLEAAVDLVPGAQGGSLWVKQHDVFRMVAQKSFDDALLGQVLPESAFPTWSGQPDRWYSGEPAIRRRSTWSEGMFNSKRYLSPDQGELFRSLGRLEELVSILTVPIRMHQEVIAHIDLDNFDNEEAMGPQSIRMARDFALQVAALLQAQRQNAEREAAYEGSLRAIGVALEARDLETSGHTDRVSELAVRMGFELGLEMEALRELRWGSYLHDIGKLAVPDHILLKPTSLDPEELSVMRSHSELGYSFTKNLQFLPEASREVVLFHHERWDGTGYPSSIKGEDIPLNARIFSVCDVFDALISPRPYKLAWSVGDAIAEIARQAERQFDPRVVTAFLKVIEASGDLVDQQS